jgi:hypothetical protein
MSKRRHFQSYNDRNRVRLTGPDCVYCGEVANTVDHFPPLAVTSHGFLLPACSECNNFAGTRNPFDFRTRIERVKHKIKTKYRAALRIPHWYEEEIDELRGVTKLDVKRGKRLRERTISRIDWDVEAYLATLSTDPQDIANLLGPKPSIEMDAAPARGAAHERFTAAR